MTDFILGLEQDLLSAARRRAGGVVVALPTRRPLRPLLVAAALVVLVAGTAAGTTLYVLRGSVIPAPSERDAGPTQSVVPGSAHLVSLRASDPAGGPPWALRLAQSKTGFVCSTVGQMVGGVFGIVGMDRRFRALAPGVVDGCGQSRTNKATLVGARVFDAKRRADVRSVVYGVGGAQLAAVRMNSAAGTRLLPVGPGGTFISVVRGYPEDAAIRLKLRFRDRHVERYPLGASPFVVVDPLGGPAWKTRGFMASGNQQSCASFGPARDSTTDHALSPPACGRTRFTKSHPIKELGLFFAVRRLVPGRCKARDVLLQGLWCHRGPRTAVWGFAGDDVKQVTVIWPDGRITPPRRNLLVVLSPQIRPSTISVRVEFTDGRTRTYRGDTNLVPPPKVR